MTNPKGYRRGTRYLFAKKFRKHGVEPLSTFLHVYKKANSTFHKGMPHKVYHGKTGTVFNVTPHALGLIVNKRVREKILAKRINVRVEHVKPSKSRESFLLRVRSNEKLRKEMREKKIKISKTLFKRMPKEPLKSHFVCFKKNKPVFVQPIPYKLIA